MLNAIWLCILVASVIAAAFNGTMGAVTTASVDSAKSAVTLAFGLIGVMAFWLGMMRIVQEGGLLHSLARGLRPIMTRLFPDLPPDHPAMSAMIMNMASNMLGLGNAATPFGLKAMMELDRLNPVPGVATNAMVLFLAINTSHLAIMPLGVIALRASLGSKNAAGIWLPTLLATAFATATALIVTKLLERVYPPVTAFAPSAGMTPAGAIDEPADARIGADRVTSPRGCLLALVSLAAIGLGFILFLQQGLSGGRELGDLLRDAATNWLLPFLIVTMLMYGYARGVTVYDAMITGAKEGFQVAVRIIPFLVAIIVAVGMFRASGLLNWMVATAGPWTDMVGFPAAALPMALLRPLSGSGAYAVMAEIMQAEGPDSYVGYLVSVLQGSTETTFYVLAVYFGAIGVTRVRHALAAGLIADLAGVVGATVATRWLLLP